MIVSSYTIPERVLQNIIDNECAKLLCMLSEYFTTNATAYYVEDNNDDNN